MPNDTDFAVERREAGALDAADSLAPLAQRFRMPSARGAELYFCGHSLGPQPTDAAARVEAELGCWAEAGVEGHFRERRPWADYDEPLVAATARLAGAERDEVAVMHSLTVNLHLMLASFYRPRGERVRILMERPAFPSDRYAVVSQIEWHGLRAEEALVEVGPRPGEGAIRMEDVIAGIEREGARLALVLLGGANYYNGQILDAVACTRAAHAVGALAGYDMAHAIGNVPLQLDAAGADFAVWCGYKYLCGGPGAPAGCFVNRKHFAGGATRPRLAGWWGNRADTRFQMRSEFEPAAGAAGWAVSSPAILPLAALEAGLAVYDAAPLDALWSKSRALGAWFDRLANRYLPGLERLTPRDAAQRGAQVSLLLGEQAAAVQKRLREAGLVCDMRGPVLRLSFHPLYCGFGQVAEGVERLAAALGTGRAASAIIAE